MIEESDSNVGCGSVVGGDLQGGEGRRELELNGRRGVASVPQESVVRDLDLELFETFHLRLVSEEKRTLARVEGLEGEDSAGWVERGEEGGGVDLGEDSNSTEIGHEFEEGKEVFGEFVGASFSSLDSEVAVEEFDGFEELRTRFGREGEEVEDGGAFVVDLVLIDGDPLVELRSRGSLERKDRNRDFLSGRTEEPGEGRRRDERRRRRRRKVETDPETLVDEAERVEILVRDDARRELCVYDLFFVRSVGDVTSDLVEDLGSEGGEAERRRRTRGKVVSPGSFKQLFSW